MKIQKIDVFGIDEAIELIWETFLKFEAPDYSSEGVIATRNDRKHICCFFVKEQFQRQGIGRKLWEYIKNNSPHNIITVNSSPYAVPVYHKLGFTDTDTEQLKDGIRYTPMKYIIL